MLEKIGGFLFRWRNHLFPALFLFLFLSVPTRPAGDGNLPFWAGIALATAGTLLRLTVAGFHYVKRAGRSGRVHADVLFTSGPFSFTRNPLYLGNLLIAAGFMVLLGHPWLLPAGLAVVAFAYRCIIAAEERFLYARFAEQYERYVREVPRWLPRWPPAHATGEDSHFCWRRALAMDYSTVGAVALGLLALTIRDASATHNPATTGLWAGVVAVLCLLAAVRLLKSNGFLRGK